MSNVALVSIYHPTENPFLPYKAGSPLTWAYSYDADADSEVHPEHIFRRNNAVDGTEENVKAKARSLSVGDVVVVGFNDKPPVIFSVATLGMTTLSETDLELSLRAGCPGCPICSK